MVDFHSYFVPLFVFPYFRVSDSLSSSFMFNPKFSLPVFVLYLYI